MKLSELHNRSFKHAEKAFKQLRMSPNPVNVRIKQVATQVYRDLWGKYRNDPRMSKRLGLLQHSLSSFDSMLQEIAKQPNYQEKLYEKLYELFMRKLNQ